MALFQGSSHIYSNLSSIFPFSRMQCIYRFGHAEDCRGTYIYEKSSHKYRFLGKIGKP